MELVDRPHPQLKSSKPAEVEHRMVHVNELATMRAKLQEAVKQRNEEAERTLTARASLAVMQDRMNDLVRELDNLRKSIAQERAAREAKEVPAAK